MRNGTSQHTDYIKVWLVLICETCVSVFCCAWVKYYLDQVLHSQYLFFIGVNMNLNFMFFTNSCLLGLGLAMDAFSVSLANGLNEPNMKKLKIFGVSGIFAFFQFAMPMIGWICVSTFAQYFAVFEKCIPWIALALLGFIGGKMLYESIKNKNNEEPKPAVKFGALLVQGIATSIDALSVGFTIAEHTLFKALLACGIIGVVTFGICLTGILIGKKAGTKLANKAGILGGIILIVIGLEIFITSWF